MGFLVIKRFQRWVLKPSRAGELIQSETRAAPLQEQNTAGNRGTAATFVCGLSTLFQAEETALLLVAFPFVWS